MNSNCCSSLKGIAESVRFFEIKGRDSRSVRRLFFPTNHCPGRGKMKDSVRKADESGLFGLSDAAGPDRRVLLGIVYDVTQNFLTSLAIRDSRRRITLIHRAGCRDF